MRPASPGVHLCGSGFDLVNEGLNGFRFDPYSIAAISGSFATMASLSNEERRRMGEHSRRIIGVYSPEVWAERLAECITAVAGD
jgi:glycosyltransferase involved in cell wall biosynthesis